jgi:beta-glucosidase
MYLGGQGVGKATVDLLYGRTNPSGKLPETFPIKIEDNPSYLNYPGAGDKVHYREGVFVGYRYYETKNMPVLFPFGHGLSYTQFEYSGLRVSHLGPLSDARRGKGDRSRIAVRVTADVTNTGDRSGKETVQLYVSNLTQGRAFTPEIELKGFEKLSLAPGETKTAEFTLGYRSFAYYDEDAGDWAVAPGEYEIRVGASSRDIWLRAAITLAPPKRSAALIVTQNTRVEELLAHEKTAFIVKKVVDGITADIDSSGESDASKEAITAEMLRRSVMEAPLRNLRSHYGFSEQELDAAIAFFNKRLGNKTEMGLPGIAWALRKQLAGLLK